MAQNKGYKKEKKEKKYYSNPVYTLWGKIIIFTLAILMACSGLFFVIWSIIQNA